MGSSFFNIGLIIVGSIVVSGGLLVVLDAAIAFAYYRQNKNLFENDKKDK